MLRYTSTVITKTADELERDVDAATRDYEASPTPEHDAALRDALRAGGANDDDVDLTIHAITYGGFGLV